MQDRLCSMSFHWEPGNEELGFLIEQKDQTGKWKVFAEDTLRRTES